MDFGIFMEFEIRRGGDQATAFREGFDVVDAAEAWGLDGVWLGEMHFTPARSVLSAPIVIASSIATRTKRLRVGMAVQVLPLNNPLRIAEEAATVDHISAGRFDFGIGRSGFPRVYDVYGIPYAESQERFREALEIILEAWKGEPFSYKGQYWSFENATVAPRPYQLPHPPIRMAATTEETFPRVGEMGLPIFVGLRGMDISDPAPAPRWPTGAPGATPGTPATATSTCAFRSTPPPPRRPRARSPSTASRSISAARPTFSRRPWDARVRDPPSDCRPGSNGSPRSRTSRSWPSASRSAARAG